MIKIKCIGVWGFEGALKGMRNPKNSWSRSDSQCDTHAVYIGDKDLELCKALIMGGTEHRKFLRMIHVQFDMSAPFYMLKEMDTYKVGTVANSCSTMHKLTAKPFELEDFSCEHMGDFSLPILQNTVDALNALRTQYLTCKDEVQKKQYWYSMVQLLPSSYNQLRTFDMNYEVLMNIYNQRKNHKLSEWHDFCSFVRGLPYMDIFLAAQEKE